MYGVIAKGWIEIDGVQQPTTGGEEECNGDVIAFCDHADLDKLIEWACKEESTHGLTAIVDKDHEFIGAPVEDNGICVAVIRYDHDEDEVLFVIVDEPNLPKLIK